MHWRTMELASLRWLSRSRCEEDHDMTPDQFINAVADFCMVALLVWRLDVT